MSEQKKVKVVVNGAEMQLPEGQPLLQALIDEKIEVPHFCYHPGIGIEGSCRLCLVEVVGQPKLATSCTVPVKEGMQVNTHTPRLRQARASSLSLWRGACRVVRPVGAGTRCPEGYPMKAGW